MALANQEAQRFNHEYIGTEHILLGLVKEGSGVGANVLKNLDIDLRKVRLEVEKLVKIRSLTWSRWASCRKPHAPRRSSSTPLKRLAASTITMSAPSTCSWACLREHDGVAAQVLMNLGLKLEEVREEVLNLLGAGVESEEGG